MKICGQFSVVNKETETDSLKVCVKTKDPVSIVNKESRMLFLIWQNGLTREKKQHQIYEW